MNKLRGFLFLFFQKKSEHIGENVQFEKKKKKETNNLCERNVKPGRKFM